MTNQKAPLEAHEFIRGRTSLVRMWLFGKKQQKPEAPDEVATPDQLMQILKSAFEDSLTEFSKAAEENIKNFEDSKPEFKKACEELDKYVGEPNVEDLWAPNINSIKAQKGSYVKTLERSLTHEKEGSFDTVYGKYKAELSYMEELISEMMRINGMFKIVVMSYSNQMTSFKKIFAGMERSRDKLRAAIDTIAPEHRRYEELRNKIENLEGMLEETILMEENRENLSKEIKLLEGMDSGAIAGRLTSSIKEKSEKSESLEKEIHVLSMRLSGILMPIERAARKMDYSYAGGKSLAAYIEKPLENFKTEHDYVEFDTLLDSLVQLIDSEKILLKGKETILLQITTIKNSNLNEIILKLGTLDRERHLLRDEISSSEHEVTDKLSKANILEDKKKELTQIEERKTSLKASTLSTKKSIENMFLKYYGKKITVSLDL